MDTLAALVVVALAAFYIARRARRVFAASTTPGGCHGCAKGCVSADVIVEAVRRG